MAETPVHPVVEPVETSTVEPVETPVVEPVYPVVEPVETPGPQAGAGFRMRYGAPAFLLGWLVTFLTFCVVVAIALDISSFAGGMGGSIGIVVFGYAVLFGIVPAVVVGMPLAALTAWPLQRIKNQWWHVAIHAAVTGAVASTIGLGVVGMGGILLTLAIFLAVAFSAAAGRASVIKLVARRNAATGG